KEDYFRKRFKDEMLASTIISHVKKSRSLHIMCHIPVFCWITARVLEDYFKTSQIEEETPKTVTQMYSHFLRVLSIEGDRKYRSIAETDSRWSSQSRHIIDSLGKLAFNQLESGNLIFYEDDLADCKYYFHEASVYSGVFTEIFKEECGLYSEKQPTLGEDKLLLFYQSAVDQALQSENGHLDLFLRFLLGLSLEANQNVLRERSINLFHCLNELNDRSLVEEIQQFLTSGSLSRKSLSPAQWSALVFILLSSEEELDVFDLKKYSASEEGLLRLLPVVKASKTSLS
ncbi:unnamed protein product, partial [Gadus morhua 'NCC']